MQGVPSFKDPAAGLRDIADELLQELRIGPEDYLWSTCEKRFGTKRRLDFETLLDGCWSDEASLKMPKAFTLDSLALGQKCPALEVVTGESGSGKTWEMLHMQPDNSFGMYFRVQHEDFVPSALRVKGGVDEPSPELRDLLNQRNDHVAGVVVGAVGSALKKRLGADFPSFVATAHGLHVVVDEVGSDPYFLRGLIGAREQIYRGLKRWFPHAVQIIAGGTNVQILMPEHGTQPDSAMVTNIDPVKETFFIDLVRLLTNDDATKRLLAEEMAKLTPFSQVVGNRRAATFAAGILRDIRPNVTAVLGSLQEYDHGFMARHARVLQPAVVAHSIMGYRHENGLRDLDIGGLARGRRMAFFAALFAGRPTDDEIAFHQESAVFSAPIENGQLSQQCKGFRRGTLLAARETQICATKDVLYVSDDHHRGRFRFTASQAVMGLLSYGGSVGAIEAKVFESVAAIFLAILAEAFRWPEAERPPHPKGALLRFLNETRRCKALPPVAPSVSLKDPVVEAVELLPPLVEQFGVFIRQPTEEKTKPGDPPPQQNDRENVGVRYLTDKLTPTPGTALVVTNADNAPFGDVLLILPGHSVFVVQAKNLTSRALTNEGVKRELHKMGFVPPGGGITAPGIPAPSFAAKDFVLQVTKKGTTTTTVFVGEGPRVSFVKGVVYAASGMDVLSDVMKRFGCPIALPVFVTRNEQPEALMNEFNTCEAPTLLQTVSRDPSIRTPQYERQSVPVLWWAEKDLYPLGRVLEFTRITGQPTPTLK